jgi:hypothetical protein
MQRSALIFPLLAAMAASADAQVMNARPGGWDLTLKDQAGVETRTKMCLKKEDLDAGEVFRRHEDAENCKTTRGVRTPTRVTYTIVCTGSEPSRSTYDLVATSPETMTVKVRTEGTDAGTLDITGRFASASCKGYDN